MSEVNIFDSETSSMPNWKSRSEGDDQPHIVQLAALRVDEHTREVKQTLSVIVKPEGWDIDEESLKIHGITKEYAMDVGVPEKLALEMFLAFHEGCSKRVAYNTTFDNRIIRIATKRYSSEAVIDEWKEGEYECAMILARKVMSQQLNEKLKNQTLESAYKHFTGIELSGAHDALNDANGCMSVYFAAKDQQIKDVA